MVAYISQASGLNLPQKNLPALAGLVQEGSWLRAAPQLWRGRESRLTEYCARTCKDWENTLGDNRIAVFSRAALQARGAVIPQGLNFCGLKNTKKNCRMFFFNHMRFFNGIMWVLSKIRLHSINCYCYGYRFFGGGGAPLSFQSFVAISVIEILSCMQLPFIVHSCPFIFLSCSFQWHPFPFIALSCSVRWYSFPVIIPSMFLSLCIHFLSCSFQWYSFPFILLSCSFHWYLFQPVSLTCSVHWYAFPFILLSFSFLEFMSIHVPFILCSFSFLGAFMSSHLPFICTHYSFTSPFVYSYGNGSMAWHGYRVQQMAIVKLSRTLSLNNPSSI